MNISVDAQIPFPRSLVFATYRDKLQELLPYMDNVHHIEPKTYRQEDQRVICTNEWHGGGDIPTIAKAFIDEQMLSWTEHNIWNEADFSLEWRITTHAFTEAVSCSGKNLFREQGDTTIVENRGELIIYPQKIDGIPDFLRSQVAGFVEELLSQKIGPNLTQMGIGVRRYLEKTTP
ncbi:hypothetical protein HRE53_12875 [Acaryochloris sp. 'Moss Beach']|uniref:hypothetical protein n=1 Tax=Acaryochloris TaxID=155977 RepID=UPI001F4576B9|nr:MULTISPECIES: hypothetical protein [Acaryochloris]QUY42685.1 hypothetical protein I1H34_26605 [Acaryochloris marina S15]UJB71766.1 hypothetical protein HRE53_12875 [Acaryochloris sp. 'Moss Beach']